MALFDQDRHLDRIAANWVLPQPVSKADAIVGLLRDAIVQGDLPPNMVLRQDRIAQRFGISKIPLREALARLESEGFVVSEPGRGIFVADLRPERIEEIFELRMMMETNLLRAAVPRMTEAALDAAARIIDLFETAPTRELGQLNWDLHSTLYGPSERELSLGILHSLHLHADRYVQLHMGALDTSRQSNEEHRALLAACRARDTDAALSILRAHLAGIGAALCRFFVQTSVGRETDAGEGDRNAGPRE